MFNHLNFTWLTGNGKAWNGNHALSLLVIVNWINAIYVQITSFNALGSIMFSTLPLKICLFDCNVKYSFFLALLFILEYHKTARQSRWNRYRVKQAFWPKAERFGICRGDLFAWTRGGIYDEGVLQTWPDIMSNLNNSRVGQNTVLKCAKTCQHVQKLALVIGHMPLISVRCHHCTSHVLAVQSHINSR